MPFVMGGRYGKNEPGLTLVAASFHLEITLWGWVRGFERIEKYKLTVTK